MKTTSITTTTWMFSVFTDTTMTMRDITWEIFFKVENYLVIKINIPRNLVFFGFLFNRELRAEPRAAILFLQEN